MIVTKNFFKGIILISIICFLLVVFYLLFLYRSGEVIEIYVISNNSLLYVY
jgi:hypothetical protein